MEIDYQRKYFQLKNQCHKHETTIAKLQAEIRQRCQSYLLYSSRNKRTNTAEGLDTSQIKEQQKSSSIKESLDESIVKKYERNQEEGQKAEKIDVDQPSEEAKRTQEIKHKQEHFAISAQLSLLSEGVHLAKIKEEEIPDTKEMIIQSYKDRIAKINEQKTKYAKQAEKKNNDLLQANIKITDLERNLETVSKSEKKLKSKLTKMGQFQEKIHKIYEEIYQNLNIKEKAIGREELDSFTERIEFILQLIAESSQGLEKSHQYSSTSNDEQETLSNGHTGSQARKDESSSVEHSQSNVYSEGFNTLTMTKYNKIHEDVSTPVAAFEDQQANESIKQINSSLEQQKNNIEHLIDEMKKEHERQIQLLKEQFEKERINLKNIFQKEVEAHQSYQAKCKALEKDIKDKDGSVSQLNQELADARQQLKQSFAKIEQHQLEISKYKEELSQSRAIEAQYQKAKEELDKSRSIIDDLQQSKLKKQYSQLKDTSLQSTKDKKKDDLANSTLKIVENLEEPYYVQEDLYSDPNDEYVKRSFIRKKIVRRNFSATAYRVVSKSKEEVDAIVHSKLHNYTDKSLQKKEKLKETLKYEKQSRKINDPNPRISQLSEQNRQSDYMQQERELVKVFQVETKTPKEIISTKKISSSNGEESICLKRKMK